MWVRLACHTCQSCFVLSCQLSHLACPQWLWLDLWLLVSRLTWLPSPYDVIQLSVMLLSGSMIVRATRVRTPLFHIVGRLCTAVSVDHPGSPTAVMGGAISWLRLVGGEQWVCSNVSLWLRVNRRTVTWCVSTSVRISSQRLEEFTSDERSVTHRSFTHSQWSSIIIISSSSSSRYYQYYHVVKLIIIVLVWCNFTCTYTYSIVFYDFGCKWFDWNV